MNEILFLKGVFKENIWGGNRLESIFNYSIPYNNTGEYWAVSAHEYGDCVVSDGIFKGMKLSSLWSKHKELFGNIEGDKFPLLVKIIDAKEDLSIQVHPSDEYAYKYENGSLGKTECWYIVDCDENAKIVVGHNAKNKEELKNMISKGDWSDLIREVPIKVGDFFQIDHGTIHAIKGGSMVLEIQQSSDITYRLYDYDRKQNGKLRELHIEKSIDVIKSPYIPCNMDFKIKISEGYIEKVLIECEYYSVKYLKLGKDGIIENVTKRKNMPFEIVSVISGEGSINGISIKKGVHFIITSLIKEYVLTGDMEIIISTVGNN
jgi:Phosphomannose isomerase